ncbi:hypothetical protein [Herbidospora cretacea]|uniref:hypothetical protein n=1 Tax=Herbidospora cretacea TaxID=28444 RepID=UPI0004C3BF2D|nr:hypothetical protein [Herbidospora cretacea]
MTAPAQQSAAGVEQWLLELSSEHDRALMEEFLRTKWFRTGAAVPADVPWDLCRRDRTALEDAAVRLIAQGRGAGARPRLRSPDRRRAGPACSPAVRLIAQGRGAVMDVTLFDGRIATLLAQPMSDSTGIAVEVWFTE